MSAEPFRANNPAHAGLLADMCAKAYLRVLGKYRLQHAISSTLHEPWLSAEYRISLWLEIQAEFFCVVNNGRSS